MRLLLTVAVSLTICSSASAHLVAHHAKHASRAQIHSSQLKNLSHARYVCRHGQHASKRWACHAVGWLTREAKETAPPPPLSSHFSVGGPWGCIHGYEGSWTANTGNGYYGGLQMDHDFMRTYGSSFMARWGTADRWPVWAQITAAERARDSGRGYSPWPNTARFCGLL